VRLATFDTVKDQLSLERHGGRTLIGLVSRIARRLLAVTAAILHNWQTGNPGRNLTAYDQSSSRHPTSCVIWSMQTVTARINASSWSGAISMP
jgi:hypothetical protein